MPAVNPKDFSAWIDKMPPGPPKLIVTGSMQVNTGGWTVTMKPAEPQGINPDIKILVIEAIAPSGQVTQVVTTIPLRYEENPAQHEYTEVTIRNDRQEFTIDVTITE